MGKRTRKVRESPAARGSNPAERELCSIAELHGVRLERRGYPDFMVVFEGEIVGFIEVKSKPTHNLRPGQVLFRRMCERHNIPFCQWNPTERLPDFFWGCKVRKLHGDKL